MCLLDILSARFVVIIVVVVVEREKMSPQNVLKKNRPIRSQTQYISVYSPPQHYSVCLLRNRTPCVRPIVSICPGIGGKTHTKHTLPHTFPRPLLHHTTPHPHKGQRKRFKRVRKIVQRDALKRPTKETPKETPKIPKCPSQYLVPPSPQSTSTTSHPTR